MDFSYSQLDNLPNLTALKHKAGTCRLYRFGVLMPAMVQHILDGKRVGMLTKIICCFLDHCVSHGLNHWLDRCLEHFLVFISGH